MTLSRKGGRERRRQSAIKMVQNRIAFWSSKGSLLSAEDENGQLVCPSDKIDTANAELKNLQSKTYSTR